MVVSTPARSVGGSSSQGHSSPGSSPPSVLFPRSPTGNMDQDITEAFGPPRRRHRAQTPAGTEGGSGDEFDLSRNGDEIEEDPDAEEEEDGDHVGLLSDSNGPSPRASMTGLNIRRRASTLSRPRGSSSSRSGSNSRTNSHSGSTSSRSRTGSLSVPPSARSRAQSLIHNIGAASRSSLELVRSRANSLARLEESTSEGYHSRTSSSDANASGQENWTFGYPMRHQMHRNDIQRVDEESERAPSQESSREVPSEPPAAGGEVEAVEEDAGSRRGRHERDETDRTITESRSTERNSSQPDVSTANPSFVTAPPTQDSHTESSGGQSWGDTNSHMRLAHRSPDQSWGPQPPL
jgi:hypothetical protein